MKTRKKNRFLTFWIACIPGAGEMYMGFMKRGVSVMLLFVLTIIVAVWVGQGAIAAFCVVEWFYSFFYTNHLASLSDEDFEQVDDEYLFGMDALPKTENFVGKYNKWIACILILIGGCLLWTSMARLLSWILPNQLSFIYRSMFIIGDYIPSIMIGCVIIYLGVRMLGGKKVEAVYREDTVEAADVRVMEENGREEKQEEK